MRLSPAPSGKVTIDSISVIEACATRGFGVDVSCRQGNTSTSFAITQGVDQKVKEYASANCRINRNLTFDNLTTYVCQMSFTPPEGVHIGDARNDDELTKAFIAAIGI
ncbi:MAG: hypothetical protein ACRCXZ_03880 [Patescibacteria group bacterium]